MTINDHMQEGVGNYRKGPIGANGRPLGINGANGRPLGTKRP